MNSIIEKYFYKQIPLILYFLRNGRNNISVISLIMSEMYFTTRERRTVEYCAYLILGSVSLKRINRLSVGIAQVQIKHWKEHGYIRNQNKYLDLITLTNPLNNYDIAFKLVSTNLENEGNFVNLLAIYRGEARSFHYTVFMTFYRLIKNYCG
jgi:hypothetical protein